MGDYKESVEYKGQDTINKFIGKCVREHWDLENIGRCLHPKSNLISAYERHSNSSYLILVTE